MLTCSFRYIGQKVKQTWLILKVLITLLLALVPMEMAQMLRATVAEESVSYFSFFSFFKWITRWMKRKWVDSWLIRNKSSLFHYHWNEHLYFPTVSLLSLFISSCGFCSVISYFSHWFYFLLVWNLRLLVHILMQPGCKIY